MMTGRQNQTPNWRWLTAMAMCASLLSGILISESAKAQNFYASRWGIEDLRVRSTNSGNLIRFSYRVVNAEPSYTPRAQQRALHGRFEIKGHWFHLVPPVNWSRIHGRPIAGSAARCLARAWRIR